MAQCKCIEVVRQELLSQDENIKYVIMDLSNIKNMSKPDLGYKTGQRITIGFTNKKKEEKTFIAHDYCPFCGIKYEPDDKPDPFNERLSIAKNI